MTESELSAIETQLKITLPDEYRKFMLARAGELAPLGFDKKDSFIFLNPKVVIGANKFERSDDATAYSFPRWWETFFMIGTNGGGDYYCLRLDNQPGIWMIGTDCDEEPTLVAQSLNAVADEILKAHRQEEQPRAEHTELFGDENEEEMRSAERISDKRAKDWLKRPGFNLLDGLEGKITLETVIRSGSIDQDIGKSCGRT